MSIHLSTALERLEQCSEEKPPFAEAVVEAVLLLDVFRGALGFDASTSRHQHNKIDILLDVAQKSHIVVEVKQHGKLKPERRLENAIKQATRYSLHLRSAQPFAIVTDGDFWVYLAIEKPPASSTGTGSRAPYRIHKLLYFHVRSQPELAALILKRSHHNTLLRLFRVLLCVRQNLTAISFTRLMNKNLDERVEFFKDKAQEVELKLVQADVEIMQSLFSGGADVASSLSREVPIEFRPTSVPKRKRKLSKAARQKVSVPK